MRLPFFRVSDFCLLDATFFPARAVKLAKLQLIFVSARVADKTLSYFCAHHERLDRCTYFYIIFREKPQVKKLAAKKCFSILAAECSKPQK